MITGGPVAATSITPTNSYNETTYPSAKAIDGETTGSSGFWAGTASTTTPSMLTLELGSSQTVSRVKLYRVASYKTDYTVKDADIQLRQADNSWLTVATLAGNTTVDSPEIAFPPAASSAVRVVFKGARVGTLALVAEVTLQLDSGPTSLPTQRFDAWGNLIQASGSIPTYGYTGREPDASGLIFYRARYYHPGLGRFTSRDPMGMAGGINPYAYASGNPVNFNDPSGLMARKVGNFASTYYGAASNSVSQAWDTSPAVTIGKDFGGLAAVAIGKATGDAALANAGMEGLAESRQSNVDTLLMLGTMGRGGQGTKTFQTYTRTNPTTGEVYSGRTSGTGTPQQNVDLRNARSPLNNRGFDTPFVDRSSTNPTAIRGREQQLIEQFGGAQSQGGTSANKINGVSPTNPNRQNYLDKALQEFGKLFGL